jgi:hypothetical protein
LFNKVLFHSLVTRLSHFSFRPPLSSRRFLSSTRSRWSCQSTFYRSEEVRGDLLDG